MPFSRFITFAWICLSLSACLPGMTPQGTLSNPAGAKAPAEEVAAPSGPKDESPSVTEVPSYPSSAVPRALDVPALPPLDGPKAGSGPVGDGGGGGSGYGAGSTQIAKGGGGFCPKPDEVSLENNYQLLDWRGLAGYGVWSEMSKTEPTSMVIGDGVPSDLYLDVQAFFANERCRFWEEPFPAVVVRLIFRPSEGGVAQAIDTITHEKNPDGYNTEFHGMIAKVGQIEVYAYQVVEAFPDGTPKIPGGYRTSLTDLPALRDIAFTTDTAHAHYLGSFTTRINKREASQQFNPY